MACAHLAAQGTPDFTGHWVLMQASETAADVAQELIVRHELNRQPERLSVERRSSDGVRSDTYEIDIVGGSVSGIAEPGQRPARRTSHSTQWADRELVMERGAYSGTRGPFTERREVWSLDDEGRLVVGVSERRSGAEPITATRIYRRAVPGFKAHWSR